jgi:hypothetical protein
MEHDDHLQQLLHDAADLGDEPVADVPGIVRRARRARRRRRALRAGGIAMVAVLAGFAVAAADTDPPEDVSTVDGPTALDTPDGLDRPEPGLEGDAEQPEPSTTSTTTTTSGDPIEAPGPATTTTAPLDRGPLRLIVSPSTLAPYASLSVRSADPCPLGSRQVHVEAWGVGGTADGIIVGGDVVYVDVDGHWSVEFAIVAIGGIENVGWANTAPEMDLRAHCNGPRQVRTADYTSARIRNGRVTVAHELTATWDGQTATVQYSGCPSAYRAYLTWGDSPPPDGNKYPDLYAVGDAHPGAEPGTWIATVDLPGYESSDGLWATAFCQDPSGVSSIWRYRPFELDPPG